MVNGFYSVPMVSIASDLQPDRGWMGKGDAMDVLAPLEMNAFLIEDRLDAPPQNACSRMWSILAARMKNVSSSMSFHDARRTCTGRHGATGLGRYSPDLSLQEDFHDLWITVRPCQGPYVCQRRVHQPRLPVGPV